MGYVMFGLHLVHCEFDVFNYNFRGMILMELVHVHVQVHTYQVNDHFDLSIPIFLRNLLRELLA